jgi:uncharacterized protein
MNWFQKLFKPRQDNFLNLLQQQAELTFKGMEKLEGFMKTNDPEEAKGVIQVEAEAAEVRRILIDELNRSFVTPIDREDIFALSRSIDDVLDYARSTVEEMDVLNVDPNPYLERMASLLRESANEIMMGVRQIKAHPGVANDHAQRAKSLENQVETVYRKAIADLFHGPSETKHIMKLLKLREVYRHLSNAADRGDEAANVISDVVVKMT